MRIRPTLLITRGNISFMLFMIISVANSFAQEKPEVRMPAPYRDVFGIVLDSAGQKVSNASIRLYTQRDTLVTQTTGDGKFSFTRVSSATFLLMVSKDDYYPVLNKYLENDEKARLDLQVVLKRESGLLKEVAVSGTPSIIYKLDTTEFKAADYRVREYATIDEMLKKMEGMEVASNGTLTYQGQDVKRAKLNGKEFAGGDVALAIKNLPADIVGKIQVIDSYEDQADRTGIKVGDAEKVLNIITKPDRSIGSLARVNAGEGNDSRYDAGLTAQYINANRVIGTIVTLDNTQNGVALNAGNSSDQSTALSKQDNGAGSGGTLKTSQESFYYRDQWGKQILFNVNYSSSFRDIASTTESYGQLFSTLGTTSFSSLTSGYNNLKSRNLHFELEYAITKSDFLRIAPAYDYSETNTSSLATNAYTGLLHQNQSGTTSANENSPKIEGLVFYQHAFSNPLRNLTVQADISSSTTAQSNDNNKHVMYYQDAGPVIIKDSLQNYFLSKSSKSRDYKEVLTYIEPAGYLSQIEIIGKVERKTYDNVASVDSVNANGAHFLLPELNNFYNYSFTEARLGIDYAIDKRKYNLSIGAAVITYSLNGFQRGGVDQSAHQQNTNLIPIFRFQYLFSRTQRLSLTYSGQPVEPTFAQLQPFTDKSDPLNTVTGNPYLKPVFFNSIITQYSNYLAPQKINLSLSLYTSIYSDQITNNVIQVYQPTLNNYINETYYLNSGVRKNFRAVYNVAKQSSDRRFILSLIGRLGYNNYTTMSNSIASYNTTWRYNERLSLRMNPSDFVEINPFISYDVNRTFFSLSQITAAIRTLTLSVDGRFYLWKTFVAGYTASKNYVQGVGPNLTENPVIINSFFEKQFLRRHNLTVGVQAFDILHQNNFINQSVTENSVTYTKTNALSRYLMVNVKLNLQKWAGTPTKNGINMQRRGDGSFIY